VLHLKLPIVITEDISGVVIARFYCSTSHLLHIYIGLQRERDEIIPHLVIEICSSTGVIGSIPFMSSGRYMIPSNVAHATYQSYQSYHITIHTIWISYI
jgi:hypothetical protein